MSRANSDANIILLAYFGQLTGHNRSRWTTKTLNTSLKQTNTTTALRKAYVHNQYNRKS